MSRLIKTSGIVVRHSAYSESSRIIQWLTRDRGRLATIAKGAMRPRNAMLGQFDQSYTCELVYYAQERDAVYITREISAIQPRSRFRQDWRAAIAAAYVGDLAIRQAPHHEPAPELFQLLDQALNEFNTRGWHAPSLLVYELRLLEWMGVAPRLHACAVCGRPFQTGHAARFSSERGGMICDRCPETARSYTVGADILAILKNWESAEGWSAARSAKCTPGQLAAIRHLIGDFLSYHLDLKPARRDATLDMLM